MSSLPHGWSAHQSPDGRWYFAHSSGTTQWHHPGSSPQNSQPSIYPNHSANFQHPVPQQQQQHTMHASTPHSSQGGIRLPMSSAAARYVLQQPVEFKLQEKAFSLSGDSFSVKRVDTGEPYFKVKGNALSLKDSKSLLDANGNAIYKMSEALLTLRGRMSIVDATNKQPVLTLRKKGFIPGFGTKTIQAWPGAAEEGTPYLEVKGDFFRKDFNIVETATGRTLASIKRKSFTLSNILLEKDSYVIRVEPGVDTALMVFFVVAVDEQYRDDGNRKGFSSFL